MVVSNLEIVAQSSTELIFPTAPNGTVRLTITKNLHPITEALGEEYLAVYVTDEEGKYSATTVQGNYKVEDNHLIFKPYFPFEKGITYVAKVKSTDSSLGHSYQFFQVGKKQVVDTAKVVSIYPSSNQLPENLLRFYFYFNTPMKKGQALKHIKLKDASGNVDEHAFMEFKQELWSPDGKRLTLLFDPGRIKRGVSTNLELGPALIEGKQYHLSISEEWQDVYGQPLSSEKIKTFEVSQAYRQAINIQEWVIDKPNANSLNPLIIHFDRIMDHALIQSMIQIRDNENNPIFGRWEILEKEQFVQFIPEKKWKRGNYQLIFDNRLEDAAGNNLNNLLDQKEQAKKTKVHSTINFKI